MVTNTKLLYTCSMRHCVQLLSTFVLQYACLYVYGTVHLNIRMKCGHLPDEPVDQQDNVAHLLGSHTHDGATIIISRGDYAPLMQRMCENLEKSKVLCNGSGGRGVMK